MKIEHMLKNLKTFLVMLLVYPTEAIKDRAVRQALTLTLDNTLQAVLLGWIQAARLQAALTIIRTMRQEDST